MLVCVCDEVFGFQLKKKVRIYDFLGFTKKLYKNILDVITLILNTNLMMLFLHFLFLDKGVCRRKFN